MRRVLAAGILTVVFGALALAEDKKEEKDAPKADVIVPNNAKTATAKAGQLVQIDINYPVIPPFPSDFVVKVDGKKVDSKAYRGVLTAPNGQPVIGAGVNMVQFKAAGTGKQNVVVEYKKGKDDAKVEINLDVKK